MLEIPITSDASHFSQEHQLFGRNYIFEFEWIERESYWVLHFYDGAQNPLALGLKIITGQPLWCDPIQGMVLLVVPKHPLASLSFKTFCQDFMLVAYEDV